MRIAIEGPDSLSAHDINGIWRTWQLVVYLFYIASWKILINTTNLKGGGGVRLQMRNQRKSETGLECN